jgi:protease II
MLSLLLTSDGRFGYTSLTTPQQVWDYDMSSGRRRLMKVPRVIA